MSAHDLKCDECRQELPKYALVSDDGWFCNGDCVRAFWKRTNKFPDPSGTPSSFDLPTPLNEGKETQ